MVTLERSRQRGVVEEVIGSGTGVRVTSEVVEGVIAERLGEGSWVPRVRSLGESKGGASKSEKC
jgi:hypothetical protein